MDNLTILAIDTSYHTQTKQAVETAVKITGSKNVVILSDKDILPGSKHIQLSPITRNDYSKLILKNLVNYVETEHVLIVQHDGMPTDKSYWDDNFLKYDYIGAPWPWLPEDRNVGNGGFSLRSRKLLEILSKTDINFDLNPVEDDLICNHLRPELEIQGIKFAPTSLAYKFSVEHPGGKFPSFGFHGKFCLPYYLDDDQLEFYINNFSEKQFNDESQRVLIYGLYVAERYAHMELMMDRGTELIPNFKYLILEQFKKHGQYYPTLTMSELEEVLINY